MTYEALDKSHELLYANIAACLAQQMTRKASSSACKMLRIYLCHRKVKSSLNVRKFVKGVDTFKVEGLADRAKFN